MKKIFTIALIGLMAVSCLKSKYDLNYDSGLTFENLNAMFQQSEEEFYGLDSVFCKMHLGFGDVALASYVPSGDAAGLIDYDGFAYSINTGDAGKDFGYIYTCNSGTASGGSKGFAVFHRNKSLQTEPKLAHDFVFLSAQTPGATCSPRACMVNNTRMVADEILNGANKFEEGDSLKILATGYLGGKETKTVGICLAKFTAAKDSVVNKWTLFDLTPLGAVDGIDFRMESTKTGIPEYFCMDDFLSNIHYLSE